jgi:hypothetical protein
MSGWIWVKRCRAADGVKATLNKLCLQDDCNDFATLAMTRLAAHDMASFRHARNDVFSIALNGVERCASNAKYLFGRQRSAR